MKEIMQKIKAQLVKIWGQKPQADRKVAEADTTVTEATSQTPKKERKPGLYVGQILSKVMLVIFAAVFCFSAYQIFKNTKQADERDELYTDLSNVAVKPADPKPVTPPPSGEGETTNEETGETAQSGTNNTTGLQIPESSPISVDFDLLMEKNSDVMAWVYCPDTPVNYPVVRGTDNDYYLNRLLDGTVNKAGSIFADCRNRVDFTDPHTLIYGHNMKDLSMFGSVNKYAKQSYYDQHPVWYINTPEKNYAVVLLAGHVTSPYAEIYAFKGTPEEPMEILESALQRSAFKSMATYEEGDHLVTFSTCHGSSSRFILVGALREIG